MSETTSGVVDTKRARELAVVARESASIRYQLGRAILDKETADMLEALAEDVDRLRDLSRRWIEAESFWFPGNVAPLHEETAAVLKASGVQWMNHGNCSDKFHKSGCSHER